MNSEFKISQSALLVFCVLLHMVTLFRALFSIITLLFIHRLVLDGNPAHVVLMKTYRYRLMSGANLSTSSQVTSPPDCDDDADVCGAAEGAEMKSHVCGLKRKGLLSMDLAEYTNAVNSKRHDSGEQPVVVASDAASAGASASPNAVASVYGIRDAAAATTKSGSGGNNFKWTHFSCERVSRVLQNKLIEVRLYNTMHHTVVWILYGQE